MATTQDVLCTVFAAGSAVNKFGRATNADAGVLTDVWDGANADDDVDVWVAPTQARMHQIVSSSDGDDGDPAGGGARTLRIYGLTAWDVDEVFEDVTLNGKANVATVNAYVIIHRMKVLTKGETATNVGTIKATADVDGSVTAQINVGAGQTQMAIYGVPSTKQARVTGYYVSAIKESTPNFVAEVTFLVNPEPGAELLNFLTKHTLGIAAQGSSYVRHQWNPFFDVQGPAIIKVRVNSSTNNTDVSAGFDLIMVSR